VAGTSSNRGEEFARVNRSESNNYESGRSNSSSPMKEGFGPKKRMAKDPANTGANTTGPNGGVLGGTKARS
jgi:hypothetical protein